MAQIQLHVYPRGYLGQMLEIEPKRDKLRSDMVYNSVIYDARIFHTESDKVLYDPVIEELYTQYVSKTPESFTAEFHQKFFAKAISIFGTMNFCQWILVHKEMRSLTPTHLAFLEDTLKFVFEGRDRKMLVQMWERILTLGTVVHPVELDSWEAIERYVRRMAGITVEAKYHYDVKSLLSRWTERSFADLVYTTHVLFGKFE